MSIKHTCRASMLVIVFLFSQLLYAQWIPDATNKLAIRNRMFSVIEVMASDSLGGREAGTIYDKKSKNFIISQFQEIGIQPFFDSTFYRPFYFIARNELDNNSYLILNNDTLLYNIHYDFVSRLNMFMLEAEVVDVGNGLYLPDNNIDDYRRLRRADLQRKAFFIDISYPEKILKIIKNDVYQTVQKSIQIAANKGASAIVLYHSNSNDPRLPEHVSFELPRTMLRVFYIKDSKTIISASNINSLQFIPKARQVESYNVAAIIDNNAPTTIIIGAHYDHLGDGKAIRGLSEPAIHYGADDNASGVAMMLELARFIKQQNSTTHNYIFVAFGAEEKGLIGSKEFVNDTVFFPKNAIAMLNLDMIGRLDSVSRKLDIYGAGSAVEWDSLISVTYNPKINLNPVQSISYGSDHVNFYRKKIPVLFFFTGLHKDYHTPNDRIEKINKEGMLDIYLYLTNFILHLDNINELTYKIDSKSPRSSGRQRTTVVSLGVVPDHAFEGNGLRIDEVITDKLAEKTGMKDGDIILKLGQYEIGDINAYMEALSNFKQGDSVNTTVKRGETIIELQIQF
jgi:aminopeptidase YwaD